MLKNFLRSMPVRIASVGLAVMTTSCALAAQRPADGPSAAYLLQRFESGHQQAPHRVPGGLVNILSEPDQYPVAKVDSILDGLEHIAVSSDVKIARHQAVVWLASAGDVNQSSPREGIVGRLARVYARAADPLIHPTVIRVAAQQRERGDAARLLRHVATQESTQLAYRGAAADAVAALRLLGPDGQRVLDDLRRGGLIRDPAARMELNRGSGHEQLRNDRHR